MGTRGPLLEEIKETKEVRRAFCGLFDAGLHMLHVQEIWEGELAFLSTLLKSISASALKLTLTTCTLIQTGVSSPPSISPACRENEILTALPLYFPLLLVHHTPQGPQCCCLVVLGVSSLSVVLFWAYPRELFDAPARKVIILPCSSSWERAREARTETPTPETIPATGSHLVPALCSWITWKAPHPSAWADAFPPCCCSTCPIPVVEGGLSHCLWYETLGCWV